MAHNDQKEVSLNIKGDDVNRVWRDSRCDFSRNGVDNFGFVDSPGSQSPNYGRTTPILTFNDPYPEPLPLHHPFRIDDEEVLICSGNSSFNRRSNLLRSKTKSRLLSPEPDQIRPLKSGRYSKIDEEDPFYDEDLPDEYKRINFSALCLLQLLSLILITTALIFTLSIKRFRSKTVFQLKLWKWELLVLVLISGRLVSGWVIRILVFLVEHNFLVRKRVLYFVYSVRNAVQNCIWFFLVLVAWHSILNKQVARVANGKVLHFVTRIWVSLLLGTLIWLLKTILVKVLASSFHVSTFFDRIQESLFNQYVIEVLSGPPLMEIKHDQEDDEKLSFEVEKLQNAGKTIPDDFKLNSLRAGRVIGSGRRDNKSPKFVKTPLFPGAIKGEVDEGITIDHLHRLNQTNVSAWNMKRLMNKVGVGALSTFNKKIQSSTEEDKSTVHITSEAEAKAAAKTIFYNVANHECEYMYLEDVMRFLREDEALKTMSLIEEARECKGISKCVLRNWVVNVFRERRALALSLNDTKTAVNKLHQMINVAVGLIILVIWLLILKIATTHFFVFLGSQLLLVAFMFGNTCKTTFEAIIFLFVMHPYDVGDRVEIDEVQMVVEEMNILTTVFLKFDNLKIIYPNSVLATKSISNYYRSPDMGDAVDFCVHVATPLEKIAQMKEKITNYVDKKTDHWYPTPMIVLREVEDMNKLTISVWLSHRMNFQDMGERWVRRALLVEEMIKIFKDLDIEYRMLSHNVNVRTMSSLSSSRVPSTWTTLAG